MGGIGQVSIEDPGKDDFELWSPSEARQEICLFGRRVSVVSGLGGTFVLTLVTGALPSS